MRGRALRAPTGCMMNFGVAQNSVGDDAHIVPPKKEHRLKNNCPKPAKHPDQTRNNNDCFSTRDDVGIVPYIPQFHNDLQQKAGGRNSIQPPDIFLCAAA